MTKGDPETRRIIHVDMDAFFASVEQRDTPALRGKPVAVGRARRRGVVAAASYEARRFGVRSAMPSVTAMHKCPDLIFVEPRFEVYRSVSAQIHEVFARYTDLIEPLSLDEAYLDVTEACRAGRTATDIAKEIRAGILAATGLTASAGVSYNKFLAKLASDQNKPDGLTVIPTGKGEGFVADLPVGRFYGVGPVTQARMESLGIRTGADLRAKDMDFLRQHFGSSAERYHAISRGIDDRPVRPNRERKSIGAETTFEADVTDLRIASEALDHLSGKVSERCVQKGMSGRTVTVKLKYGDFEQHTRQRTVTEAIQSQERIAMLARSILQEEHPFKKPVRLLGVTVSGLEEWRPEAEPQLDLFER
ncbi:DNA polymerase IV [Leisingera sp. XS_AS12]|uniref:DNA polymerase IV n=1 Tax=Leisingera sp. XS_AS12 TaxID=3241294 RepID=UPI003518F871